MKKIFFYFLRLFVSVLLIIYIFSKTDFSAIWQTLNNCKLWFLALAFSLHIIGFTISAYRWKMLLKIQKLSVSAWRLFISYIVGQFFNFFFPTTVGGDLFRVYDTRKISQGTARSAVVIFIERLTGLFALLVIACVSAIFGKRFLEQVPEVFAIILIFLLAVIFLIFLFLNKKTSSFFKKISGFKIFPEKVKTIFLQFSEVIENFRVQPLKFTGPLVLAFLLQLNVAIHIYLIALSVKIDLPVLYFFILVPIIQVLLMVPVSFGGLGLSENIYAFFLGKLGVPVHQAVALSLLSLGLRFLIGVTGALIYNFLSFEYKND